MTGLSGRRRSRLAVNTTEFDVDARKNCAGLIDDGAADGNTGLALSGRGESAQNCQHRYDEELPHVRGVYSARARRAVTFDNTPSSIGVMIRS